MAEQTDIESIFLRALEISDSAERAAYLEEACASNLSLREEVERLLGSHEVAGSFLEVESPLLHATELQCVASRNESVLQAMHDVIGPTTAISLKEDIQPEPVQSVNSVEIPKTTVDGRYQLQGEIARGGMGAVIKGRDTDLGRDLAVKVLLESHRAKPEIVQRFVEEAQIGGQLQHPGIAPVYELGQFEDQRPYFTMKLVKGKTLAALLAERASLEDERSKFIGIFEQICQTMAYAHSRGVIHRDLKPTNIMVGAFGEVQVMDWGLAKVLKTGGIADETRAKNTPKNQSIIETLRSSGSDTPLGVGSQTQMGSVMGTPAYMPPEQALGEIDQLDERCDVFGLGAILCEILTGHPPYLANDNAELIRMATRGKVEDCFARLDECGADDELIAISKRCLSPDIKGRPLHAGLLSDAITSYLEAVDSRLRESEIDRAAQAARVVEEQKRRKLSAILLTAIALLIAALGGSGIWLQRQKTQAAEELSAKEAERAEQERKQKEANRELLYGAQINLAASELRAGQTKRAKEILEAQRAEGADDLRGFEWHFLRRQCMDPVETVDLNWVDNLPLSTAEQQTTFWAAISGDKRIMARFLEGESKELSRIVLSEVNSQRVVGDFEVGNLGHSSNPSLKPRLVLSEDGSRFALRRGRETLAAEVSHSVEIWDAIEGQLIRSIKVGTRYRSRVSVAFAFSPDARQVAVTVGELFGEFFDSPGQLEIQSADARCKLYDISTGETLWSTEVEDCNGAPWPVFSPDGESIALARNVGPQHAEKRVRKGDWAEAAATVLVLDSASGNLRYTKELLPNVVNFQPTFSPNSTKLVMATSDRSLAVPGVPVSKEELLWIWDAELGTTIICEPIGQLVSTVEFSQDGELIAIQSTDGSASAVVNLMDGSLLARIRTETGCLIRFSADSRFLESVGRDGTLTRWRVDRNPFRGGKFGWSEGVGLGCTSFNGSFLARLEMKTSDILKPEPFDTLIRVYSSEGAHVHTVQTRTRWPSQGFGQPPMMALTEDGSRLSVLRVDQETEREQIVTYALREETEPQLHYQLASGQQLEILFSDRDGSQLGATFGSEDKSENQLWLWDTRTGRAQTLTDPKLWVWDTTLSPDGKLLATEFCESADGAVAEVRVYRTTDLQLVATHPTKFDRTFRLRFDNAGRQLAIAAESDQIVLWDIETGISKVIHTQWGRRPTLAFNSDGTRLFAISDGTLGQQLRIWNTKTGTQVFNQFYAGLKNKSSMQLAFQPQTQRLIGWPIWGPPHIWDARPVEATINR